VIQRAELVVSMRLHALIFATGQGVPSVGVVYDPKVRAYMDYLGEHQYLDLSDVSGDALISLVRKSLDRLHAPDVARLCRLARENQAAAASLLELPMPANEENA
jgi:polysaccharide pyruvyl transferase WcaK-like protein